MVKSVLDNVDKLLVVDEVVVGHPHQFLAISTCLTLLILHLLETGELYATNYNCRPDACFNSTKQYNSGEECVARELDLYVNHPEY